MKTIKIFEKDDVVAYIGKALPNGKPTDIGIVRGITLLDRTDEIAILVDLSPDERQCAILNPNDLVYLGRLVK